MPPLAPLHPALLFYTRIYTFPQFCNSEKRPGLQSSCSSTCLPALVCTEFTQSMQPAVPGRQRCSVTHQLCKSRSGAVPRDAAWALCPLSRFWGLVKCSFWQQLGIPGLGQSPRAVTALSPCTAAAAGIALGKYPQPRGVLNREYSSQG